MATPLPPTVGERLAACGTQVEVWGIAPGARVDLDVGGTFVSATVNDTAHRFALPALTAGVRITARQEILGNSSGFGNVVVVEDVQLPPAPPVTDPQIATCARCIQAWGVAPGSEVRVFVSHLEVAKGLANGQGFACMDVNQRLPQGLLAQARTCGQASPNRPLDIYDRVDPIPPPGLVDPVFECQSAVLFEQLVPGAVYEIFVTDSGGVQSSLGTFCACAYSVHVNTGRNMKPGDRLKAIGRMDNPRGGCNVPGEMSDEIGVVPPDGRIKPVILGPVLAGEQQIYVSNQVGGATLTLFLKSPSDAVAIAVGERPASAQHPEVSVGVTLNAGDVIHVAQQLCGVTVDSDPVEVEGLPGQVLAVKVREPVHACSGLVIIDEVVPGADVFVKMVKAGMAGPEIPIGKARAFGKKVVCHVSPAPQATFEIVAYQRLPSGILGPPSQRVSAQSLVPAPPVIELPVQPGDSQIWCEQLIVGAYVRIYEVRRSGNTDIHIPAGGGVASGSAGPIPLWGTTRERARYIATQSLCTEGRPSGAVSAERAQCDGPPAYNPGSWNVPGVIENNNCYNYSTDKRTDTFAQPGSGGTANADCQCPTITARALGDKLRRCEGEKCHPCHHRVALVMAPGDDYHWYRQDADGTWSHKPGGTNARNTDNSGNPIYSPETADRGSYTQFCGYFCVYKPEVSVF